MIGLFLFVYRYWYDTEQGRKEGSIEAENMLDAGDKICDKHSKDMKGPGYLPVWGFIDLILVIGFFFTYL
jgi:hypothetical protein